MASQFLDMKSSLIFFEVVIFLLSSLVPGPSFMSITSLVLTIFFYKTLTTNPKTEIPPFEFSPISGDWGE